MTDAELRSAFERIDAMSERVERIMGREREVKPLRPDVSYPRRVKPKPVIMPRFEERPAVACGPLTGNEMRISNGYKSRLRESGDCDPDGMWGAFEADFDDMVKGMH